MINIQNVFKALNEEFPHSKIKINGFSELDEHYRTEGRRGNHLKLDVTSEMFIGKPLLEQHRLVHMSIEHLMQINGGFIHAVTIKTRSELE